MTYRHRRGRTLISRAPGSKPAARLDAVPPRPSKSGARDEQPFASSGMTAPWILRSSCNELNCRRREDAVQSFRHADWRRLEDIEGWRITEGRHQGGDFATNPARPLLYRLLLGGGQHRSSGDQATYCSSDRTIDQDIAGLHPVGAIKPMYWSPPRVPVHEGRTDSARVRFQRVRRRARVDEPVCQRHHRILSSPTARPAPGPMRPFPAEPVR